MTSKFLVLVALIGAFGVKADTWDSTIQLKMKYAKNSQGKKIFGCQYFSSKEIGVCNMSFEWTNKAAEEFGYRLYESKEQKFTHPPIPAGCELRKFSGHISSQGGWVQQISLQLRGPNCGSFIDSLKTSKIQMEFKDVPSEVGTEVFSLVQMDVDDLP